ncbi:MAG: O-acetyl-ADP-ribose deacetylase [Treponema sp.]|jgi:O-acetyl-ADP-ribose deacetylase (regulator of RNase III)|nr:O-acetyl-ADP-ribose deacetylase [Treponema sp.]
MAVAVIELIQGDITTADADVIVNAANSALAGGGGVDGAIHRAAGPGLHEACMKIAAEKRKTGADPCPTGEAVLTGAFNLRCKGIIHTAGPVWHGGDEEGLLASCYRKSLLLAQQSGFASIAFPNISTGVYGYPKDLAADTAVKAVRETLPDCPGIKRVVFVCFDRENYELYKKQVGGN